MSYSPDLVAIWQRAAYSHVDKILKGSKPGDLPVEQPTEFDLLLNLTAAKEIGLAGSPSFRLRATRVMTLPVPPPGHTRSSTHRCTASFACLRVQSRRRKQARSQVHFDALALHGESGMHPLKRDIGVFACALGVWRGDAVAAAQDADTKRSSR